MEHVIPDRSSGVRVVSTPAPYLVMDTASAAFFVTDAEYSTLERTVLKLVNSFYKEISSLICSYVHCRLQVGQVIDVYDDWTSWILGSVIALHEGYVAIHYNGYG